MGLNSSSVQFINTTDHNGDSSRPASVQVTGAIAWQVWSLDANPGWALQGQWQHGRPTGAGGGGVFNPDYIPHHEPFQYFASTANPQHLPPTSVAMIGRQDQANHQYDLKDFWAAADSGNLSLEEQRLLDNSLTELYQRGDITYDTAVSHIREPSFLRANTGEKPL